MSAEAPAVDAAGAGRKPASIHFACPRCERTFILPVAAASPAPNLACDHCGFPIQFSLAPPDPTRAVEQCAWCRNREFYVQKDFNRRLGLFLVVLSGLIALLVMLLWDHRLGIGVLVAVTAADWVVFRCLPEVAVCYLCHTIYRGYPRHPAHQPFYLGHEERYKKLRQEWMDSIRR